MRKGKWRNKKIRVGFVPETGLTFIIFDFVAKTVKIKCIGLVGDDDFSVIPYREMERSGGLHYRKTIWLSLCWTGLKIGRLRPTERLTKIRDRHGRCYVFTPTRKKAKKRRKFR